MSATQEPMSISRRFRRSSNWMVAAWCLFEHVRNRYCLRRIALIDDFGHTLVWSGKEATAGTTSDDLSTEVVMVNIPLPGREHPGVLYFHAHADIARPALEDLESGLGRIFAQRAVV